MKKVLLFTLAVAMIFSITACTKAPEVTTEKVDFPAVTFLYNTGDSHKAIGEYLQSAVATV
ncbi:MAG: hypothetical protein II328_04480, partial [Clostridia bacterium]|nr:hypothetical protein [Clostridia bacterium]